ARPGRPDAPAAAQTADPATTETADAAPQVRSGGGIRTMSPEEFQAGTAVDIWVEQLNDLRDDAERLRAFNLTPAAASDLISEMIHGLRRLDVIGDMRARLKAIDYGMTVDKQAPPAAIVCAECINRFVHTLGADRLAEGDRPAVALPEGGERPVFAPRPEADSAMTLPADPRPSAEETWTDWVYALDTLFTGNARDTDAGEINIEQNLALGRVLGGLEGRDASTPDQGQTA
uniref:virulence factor SrfC family protein n=1 Tax=Roseovarius halophilus (ex Wu et al. 2025) TaxID=3376060 RepID=UPI00399C3BB9